MVRIIPVHPIAQAHGLLSLHCSVAQHALLTLTHELVQPVVFNIFFGPEPQRLLDFYFDPQALTVEAILVAQLPSTHGPIAVHHILIGPPPAVMDP